MSKITINTTDGSTLEFELEADRYRIGRAQDNDLVVPDGSVSSYHGEIFVTDSGIEFHDLGSTNGTHVNGQRVEKATLVPGQEFRIGNCSAMLNGAAAADSSLEEAPEPSSSSYEESSSGESSWDPSSAPVSAAPISGLGATPCPTNQRSGFGPKVKKKAPGSAPLMILGVLGIVACAAGAFLIMQMGG